MSGYSWVAVISIFCYLFLLMTFVTSKKPKKVIKSFMVMLAIMILWNGGSLGMRMELWPSPYFWHHVSLLGMMMVTVGYYHLVLNFLDEKRDHGRTFWSIFYVLIFIANCITNFFVPLPEIVKAGGQTQFLYHYNWHIYVLGGIVAVTILQLTGIVWRHCRGNRIAFHQILPVITGLLIMLFGHILATLPMFVGLPMDMISGVFNAFFLFYALYRKKLVHISILLSKYNYGLVSVMIGFVFLTKLAPNVQEILMTSVGFSETAAIIAIAVVLVILVIAVYLFIKFTTNAVFTRTEHQQKELVAHFSEEITHMLSVDDILPILSDTICKVADVERLFVLIRNIDGNYYIEHTIRPLDEKNFFFRADHPLVTYYASHTNCLRVHDFARTTIYRSMWEKEKMLLHNLKIEYIIPLIADGDLVGLAIASAKPGKSIYHPAHEWFHQSVAGISAVAIKNASAYEKAIKDAQKDELTGLVNNKFFEELLSREFEKSKDSVALSLCIINIDDFKIYNQMYGSLEGDIALQRIAGILSSAINDNSFAARIGGDEFALILPGYDIYSAKCLAENIAAQINEIGPSITSDDEARRLTASIGLCAAPYMASSPKELYRNTDMTVYTVKRAGKNAVQMYSAEIYPKKTPAAPHKSGYSENASTIYALSAAIDAKDHYTFQHSKNVAYYASSLAKAVGMEQDLIEIVREAGLLHDIGKIGIREEILNKPGKLTPDQYEAVKKHVENAVNIIRYLPSLDYVIPAVLSHHERFDGTGYPNKLTEDKIPITGRILSIADAFDAMTSERSYRGAMTKEEAVRILRMEAGKQFDPLLVRTFVELLDNGDIELCAPKQPGAPTPEEIG